MSSVFVGSSRKDPSSGLNVLALFGAESPKLKPVTFVIPIAHCGPDPYLKPIQDKLQLDTFTTLEITSKYCRQTASADFTNPSDCRPLFGSAPHPNRSIKVEARVETLNRAVTSAFNHALPNSEND